MAEKRFERHKQPWTGDELQKLHTLAKKGMARSEEHTSELQSH